MTKEQLKTVRKSWRYSQNEMAEALQTPLRTYQDWESGRGRIPGVICVTLTILKERDEKLTAEIVERCRQRVLQEYPAGIPSEQESEEESL